MKKETKNVHKILQNIHFCFLKHCKRFRHKEFVKFFHRKIIRHSCDIIAHDRLLPKVTEGDIIGVLDAGAYGFSMASNYNNRLRPAEILIRENGEVVLTRKRDTFEDLTRNLIPLK